MANGNNDVGSATATRKLGQPVVDDLSVNNGCEPRIDPSLKTGRPADNSEKGPAHAVGLCGAMSQQGGEFRGNVSAPQQFVHLVGCRDRKAGASPEARPYSNPLKR